MRHPASAALALAVYASGCSPPPPPRPAPAVALAPAAGAPAGPQSRPSGALDGAGFRALMGTIAEGWNTGDSRRAADCFAEDAVYLEPPTPRRTGAAKRSTSSSAAPANRLRPVA